MTNVSSARVKPEKPMVMSNSVLRTIGAVGLWCLGAVAPAGPPPRAVAERPNIVFILCDDLAQGDLGCYGQKLIKTPHLDRMAAGGTRFTQAFCGTSVCAPSRASLLTGLHCGHCPIRANREQGPEGQMPLPAGTFTVAQLLHDAGYATACIGKWGLGMFDTPGSPLAVGFDHFYGYNCQRHAHDYFPRYLYDDARRFELPGNDGHGRRTTYAQDLIADDALAWVRAHQDGPFFLYYALTLPHGPPVIDSVGEYADTDWTPREQAYAAQVTRADADIGRLFALLRELRLDERTIVFLAGDNGSAYAADSAIGRRFQQAAGGLRGIKRSLYEGALRQAAIVRWPGIVPAGRVTDEPWAFWDFLPTAAELAGAAVPPAVPVDGLSLVDLLKGGAAPQREFLYWELHEDQPLQAVRFGAWKAVKNGAGAAIELYDLSRDPGEADDLAAQRPDIVARAEAFMREAHRPAPQWPLGAEARPRPDPDPIRSPSPGPGPLRACPATRGRGAGPARCETRSATCPCPAGTGC